MGSIGMTYRERESDTVIEKERERKGKGAKSFILLVEDKIFI